MASKQPVTIFAEGGHTTLETDGAGHYDIVLPEQSVTVQGPPGFSIKNCPGATGPNGTCTVTLNHDFREPKEGIDFIGAPKYKLSGKILDGNNKGVPNYPVEISGPSQEMVATNAEGEFSTELPEGTYEVTPQPQGSAVPEPSPSCIDPTDQITNQSAPYCNVKLTQDQSVSFRTCVQPNPDGKPLPVAVKPPIPGSVETGALVAVGCFQTSDNNIYTSSKPVRLDGLDIVPETGQIEIDKNTSHVTSTGRYEVYLDGYPVWGDGDLPVLGVSNPTSLSMFFNEEQTPWGDLGANSVAGRPVFPNIFGFPIAPLGAAAGITLQESKSANGGQTTIPLNLLFGGTARYDYLSGKFTTIDSSGKTSSALAEQWKLTVATSNLYGFQFSGFCSKLEGLKPELLGLATKTVNLGKSSFSGELCINSPSPGAVPQLTAKGKMDLPFAESSASGEFLGVRPTLALEGKLGWANPEYNTQLLSLAGQLDALNVQLGDFLYLQRFSFQWQPDYSTDPPGPATFGVGAGVSLGPKVSLGRLGSAAKPELLSLDGSGQIKWGYPTVLKLQGALTFLRETAFEQDLANSSLTWNYDTGEVLLNGNLNLGLHLLGAHGALEGWMMPNSGELYMHGAVTVNVGPIKWDGEAILSDQGILACSTADEGQARGGSGFEYIWATGQSREGPCNLGPYRRSRPGEGAKSSASGAPTELTVHAGTSKEAIRLSGRKAAPAVRLRGPGITLTVPASANAVRVHDAQALKEPQQRTTLIVLDHPRGGRYEIEPLPGSSPIAGVSDAVPEPLSRISSKVHSQGCQAAVSYHAHRSPAQQITLIAEGGGVRQRLGTVTKRQGSFSFDPSSPSGGSGHVLAIISRNGLDVAVQTLGSYSSPALTTPPAPTHLRLSGSSGQRVLSWSGVCGARLYKVSVTAAGNTVTKTVNGTALELPGVRGTVNVTIAPINLEGVSGEAATGKLNA